MNARCSIVLAFAVATTASCTPNRADVRASAAKTLAAIMASKDNEPKQGQMILPKRVGLKVAVIPRPFEDPSVNGLLWSTVDEQALSPETRRSLEANGLRVGILNGNVPPALEALMSQATPAKDRVTPVLVDVPDGEHTDLSMVNNPKPVVSMLLNREGRIEGKEFRDAKGLIRLTATHSGPNAVSLKFTPEIHHGASKHTFAAAPNAGPFNPQQFIMQDGQEVESLREIAAWLTVQPGQVAVLGCRGKRDHSLGDFMFIQDESNSDRLTQCVVLVWAWQADVTGTIQNKPPEIARSADPTEPPALGDKEAAK